MSKKPTEATQNLRDKAEDYISSLEGEGRFTLPELIEHLEAEHPDVISKVNNLRVTVANTLKHFDGSVILNTGEKDAESKRKGPNPVVWRRMTTDDELKAELQAQTEAEKIEGTSENWENGELGQSEEHAVVSDLSPEEVKGSVFGEDTEQSEEQAFDEEAPEEKALEEPMHEDIESAKEEAQDEAEQPHTEQVETDSSSEDFDF